jgi:hypothetical protein
VDAEKEIRGLKDAGYVIPPAMENILQTVPRWDRKTRELRYGETLCRGYAREAANQFAVLDAFEAAGWPRAIDSPFPGNESRLRETIRGLNEDLLKESPIRFRGSAKPEWYPV